MQQIVIQNIKMIAAVRFILAFALSASSQAITSAADEDGTHPAILTAQSKPANSLPVVVTWDYYAQPKTLIVHALNNSGKDIVGYTLNPTQAPDGTLDKGGWSETWSDMLAMLVDIELANEPVEESERKSDSAFSSGPLRPSGPKTLRHGNV